MQVGRYGEAGDACWDAMSLDDCADVLVQARSLLKLASFEGREDLWLFDADSADFLSGLDFAQE